VVVEGDAGEHADERDRCGLPQHSVAQAVDAASSCARPGSAVVPPLRTNKSACQPDRTRTLAGQKPSSRSNASAKGTRIREFGGR